MTQKWLFISLIYLFFTSCKGSVSTFPKEVRNDTTAIYQSCLMQWQTDHLNENVLTTIEPTYYMEHAPVYLENISINMDRASCLLLNKETGTAMGYKLEKEGNQWKVLDSQKII